MAQPTRDALDGDHPVEMACDDCGGTFWTDETQANDCPACGTVSMTPA
jgi:Zn finger protein HypA/HybF involved in hydrogenase expression